MKKIFLFAIAAATMATGCAKLQEIINPGDKNQPVDENSPVEIKFSTNVINVETKANGAVTELGNAHTLYIYGLNQTTLEEGVDPKNILNEPAISTAKAGNDAAGEAAEINWANNDTKHYYKGTTDQYDFYGYYVDDAVEGTPTPSEAYTLDVTITGQQDILLAKALGSAAKDSEGKGVTGAYSAKTARAGVVPTLEFNHQLSQFTFKVKNMGKTNMTLKGISIETVNKGVFTVAGANAGLAAGTGTGKLALPGVSNVELTGQAETNSDDQIWTEFKTDDITHSIMAFPNSSYTAKLYLWQKGAMAEGKVREISIPVTITNGAQAGTSYELQVTIYSLEEVNLKATLVGWKQGSPFVFDMENNEIEGEDDKEVDWPNNDDNTDNGNDNQEEPFSINPTTVAEIEAAGGTFIVTASAVCTVSDEAEWLTVDDTAAPVYTFTATEYTETTEPRTATITFTPTEGTPVTLTVTQAAAAQGNDDAGNGDENPENGGENPEPGN